MSGSGVDALAESVRRLLDVVVRTHSDNADEAAALVDQATALLQDEARTAPWVPNREAYTGPPAHNPVLGTQNPVAAPVVLTQADADGVRGHVRFGWAYEGAPGLVHGGVLSMVLDQLLGEAGVAARVAGMTVGLELSYKAPTRLHTDLVLEARVVEAGDRKVRMEGTIRDGDTVTVLATGTFFRLTPAHAEKVFSHLRPA